MTTTIIARLKKKSRPPSILPLPENNIALSETAIVWFEDTRLIPLSITDALSWYEKTYQVKPAKLFLHPKNLKYASEAPEDIKVIIRHGVLRGEVWFPLPPGRQPIESTPQQPEPEESPPQQENHEIYFETPTPIAKKLAKSKSKKTKRIMKQKPIMKHHHTGRPRKKNGLSRTTRWRRQKEHQLEFNDLGVNKLINQAKKARVTVRENMKKVRKGGDT